MAQTIENFPTFLDVDPSIAPPRVLAVKEAAIPQEYDETEARVKARVNHAEWNFVVTRRVPVRELAWYKQYLYKIFCRWAPQQWRVPPYPTMKRGNFDYLSDALLRCTSPDDQINANPRNWAWSGTEVQYIEMVCRPQDPADESRRRTKLFLKMFEDMMEEPTNRQKSIGTNGSQSNLLIEPDCPSLQTCHSLTRLAKIEEEVNELKVQLSETSQRLSRLEGDPCDTSSVLPTRIPGG